MILAYIDPGQGMLIWQAIVSAFVGILFYLKKTREFIVSFFMRIFGRRKTVAPDVTSNQKVPSVPVEVEAR